MSFYELLVDWLKQIAVQYQFFGVLFISFIGSGSIIFPVPYTLIILVLGINHAVDPLILTAAGSLGSAIGEFSGYVLGYYGAKRVSVEKRKKMEFFVKVFNRYGSIAIFLFALTPLPDDLLIIPLGILRYNFWRVFAPVLLGKFFMCLLLAYFGNTFGSILISTFGEENFWIGIAFTLIFLIIILIILLKVDWEKVFQKYAAKKV